MRGVWVAKPAGCGLTAREVAYLPPQPLTALPLTLQHRRGNICSIQVATPAALAHPDPSLALPSALEPLCVFVQAEGEEQKDVCHLLTVVTLGIGIGGGRWR